MPNFSDLLQLQHLDTLLTQLHHRRGHLPEHTAYTEANDKLAKLAAGSAATRLQHEQLTKEMQHLEHQVHELDEKIDHLNAQMFADAARSPRELQALEADIASVKKRRSELEDQELALLETYEPIDAEIQKVNGEAQSLQQQQSSLRDAIAAAQAAIDVEASQRVAERTALGSTLDASLMSMYEKVRSSNNGIGAAALEHGTCMSCRLKIAAVEMDRITKLAADELVRCDECGAILVRQLVRPVTQP